MTTRVTEGARREKRTRAAALVFPVSRGFAARARVHSPPEIRRKRETTRRLQLLKVRENKSAYYLPETCPQ